MARHVVAVAILLSIAAVCCAQAVSAPANTDFGTCICDLTTGICDSGCCCDTACSATQIAAFQSTNIGCLSSGKVPSTVTVCVSDETVAKSNYDGSAWLDGQICVVRDNNQLNGTFLVDPGTDFQGAQFSDPFSKYPFSYSVRPTNTTAQAIYLEGNSIITGRQSTSYTGTLTLPTSVNGICDDGTPASFLVDDSHTCNRQVQNVDTQCNDFSALWYTSIQLATTPAQTPTLQPTLTAMTCLDSAGAVMTCPSTTVPDAAISNDGLRCENVLLQISYVITFDNANTISTFSYSVVLGTLASGAIPASISQQFDISFAPASTSGVRVLSGAPGYVVGRPVLAGTLSASTLTAAPYINVPTADVNGVCGTGSTALIYGADSLGGCVLQLTLADFNDCTALRTRVLAILTGASTPTHVAMWGASDPAVTADWVELENTVPTSAATGQNNGQCAGLVTELDYEFLVASLGAEKNPQAKIVAARTQYKINTWKFNCYGMECGTGSTATQPFEVRVSTAFAPVPAPTPIDSFPPYPPLLPKLSNGVFYPFRLSSDGARPLPSPLVALVACLIALLAAALAGR